MFIREQSPQDTHGSQQPAVSFKSVRKTFDTKTALNNLNLDIPCGSMFGIVGPNGAGKTTALSIATGILRPSQGTVSVFGEDVWTNPVRAKQLMGVLPDGIPTYDRLTAQELLRYTGLLRGMNVDEISNRSEGLISALGLTEAGNTPVMDYSAGMKKKIGLAAALIHAPKLVLLDEPFEAVDPVSSQTIRKILQQIVRSGGTVVLSSHVMELVEQLCDRIAIVNRGQVIASGTVEEVRGESSLQEFFVHAVGGSHVNEQELKWLG